MKPFILRLLVVAALLGQSRALDACTGIRIEARDGAVIAARTMEFAVDLRSSISIIPRGTNFVGTTPGGTPGQRRTIRDNLLGVLTISPTFDWHVTNLRNYVNLTVTNVSQVALSGINRDGLGQGTGMLGLPGDFTPPCRFIRAVAFAQTALPVATAEEEILQAFDNLNQFDIPKGAARVMKRARMWSIPPCGPAPPT
jgi:penicillin V acylase-like amidase (Ntn superfamily)